MTKASPREADRRTRERYCCGCGFDGLGGPGTPRLDFVFGSDGTDSLRQSISEDVMYLIYLDEAGTSAKEPWSIVCGIVVQSDKQWSDTKDALERICDYHVPTKYRNGFIFHAKDIWGSEKYRDGWSKEERIRFIESLLEIPACLDLAVSFGVVKRTVQIEGYKGKQLSQFQLQHALAFAMCVSRANKYIRDFGQSDEKAALVAEDSPQMRDGIKHFLEMFRSRNYDTPLLPPFIVPTARDIRMGQIKQTNAGKIDRIIDTVNFVKKSESDLIQIADLCAFVMRRFICGQEHGPHWLKIMINSDYNPEEEHASLKNSYRSEIIFTYNNKYSKY